MSGEIPGRFDDASRSAIYRIMELRRDIRKFCPGEIDASTLDRILHAADVAPSVGFSQPWVFIVVRDPGVRARVRESFIRCREAEAARFPADRREKYLAYKLEGIAEATLNLCVAADLRPRDEAILGTTVQPEAVRASVSCAVQNLWLAARAEGLGVGWVSIVEPAVLRRELNLPAGVEPIAYLCIGHAEAFHERPMLEATKWRERRALSELVHRDRFRNEPPVASEPLAIAKDGGIPPFDRAAASASLEHQGLLTKPQGSLGRLEELAAWYAGAHGRFPPPRPESAEVAVFCADHGVVVEGVSAYPSSVTAAMVVNVMAGGAAISCLAERLRIGVTLVDVGVAGDVSFAPTVPRIPLVQAKVRAGTGNIRVEAAMTPVEARTAIDVGRRVAAQAIDAGKTLLGVGEIGIGNTTSAAALLCALTGAVPNDVVGTGTGIGEDVRSRKVKVVEDALRRHRSAADDPLALLAALGGLELAAMCGFLLEAARRRVPVVLDGYLASAAALVSKRFDASVTSYLLASHVSAEHGSVIALSALGLRPLLDLGLRLGEGTGAVLAMDLVRTAVDVQLTMATFATAGVART
jgi:nicotinate-nucleotide--dimethylbenzimidazole phosphoribosyltransferase